MKHPSVGKKPRRCAETYGDAAGDVVHAQFNFLCGFVGTNILEDLDAKLESQRRLRRREGLPDENPEDRESSQHLTEEELLAWAKRMIRPQ